MRSCIDLFSGIGGFALACHANGVQTDVFCESNERCADFLVKTWGRPVVKDIRDFDGSEWGGRWLLTAGVPCQPASRAGKQRGEADDRWLWPEALRVLAEAKPDWCIFENPPGIGDVGLDGILAQMESIGYEIAPIFDIPACAINSPQLRHRYYIVGHATSEPGPVLQREERCGMHNAGRPGKAIMADAARHRRKAKSPKSRPRQLASGRAKNVANSSKQGLEKSKFEPVNGGEERETIERGSAFNLANPKCSDGQPGQVEQSSGSARPCQELARLSSGPWDSYVWVPCADGQIRRAPSNSVVLVDGLHRSILQALGNSIVWQVAAEIIAAMIQAEDNQ